METQYEITLRTNFTRPEGRYAKMLLPSYMDFTTAVTVATETLKNNPAVYNRIHAIRTVPILPNYLVQMNELDGSMAETCAKAHPYNKVDAIKHFRDKTKEWVEGNLYGRWEQYGLKESKELIEYYLELNA